MLHGMIPAAFFATILRRYLDSLSETPAEYATSSSTLGCLGTSAIVATVGMAAYGVSRLTRKKSETLQIENDETVRPPTPPQEESRTRVNRKPPPRKVTRKRHRKNKKWFLKHMRHYKSKYGRQIGKLMNQFLGVPIAEPPAPDPSDLDTSDEEDDHFEVFGSPPYNGDTDERCEEAAGIYNSEDSAAPRRDRFEDDDEDMEEVGMVRKKSSSLDLKNLLRDNFEMQRNRRCSRRDSFDSQRTLSSSGSYKSGCSEDNMVHHSRSSSKRSRCSVKMSKSNEKADRKPDRRKSRKKRQLLTNTKRTRSGRCYSK